MNKGQLSGMIFLLFWGFWLYKSFVSANGQADVCRTLEFTPPLDAYALAYHVIRSIFLERQDACRVACYLDNDCLSYNFGRLQDGTSICQLSDSDHIQHPGDLKKSSGFIYQGTENACSKNLCSTHGKCKIDPTDNTYFCKCEDGFVGKYCEEDSLCDVHDSYRLECGWPGIQSDVCLDRGCCWDNNESDVSIRCFSHLDKTCESEDPAARKGCGWAEITREECTTRGCCWNSSVKEMPWCFFGPDYPIFRCTAVEPSEKTACGYAGITNKMCVKNKGCCWDDSVIDVPWCFHPEDPA